MEKISLATGSLGQSRVLEKLLKISLEKISPADILDYSDTSGLPELRVALAALHDNIVSGDNIFITSSGQQALALLTETCVI